MENIDKSGNLSKETLDKIADTYNQQIEILNTMGFSAGKISDGYHTFDELYEFRKMYNACLFNEWAARPEFYEVKYNVHKSWKHSNGELAFGGGWFIVSAMLPTGLISNHYKAEDWDLFRVPEVEQALFEYDGHTAQDVLERLKAL